MLNISTIRISHSYHYINYQHFYIYADFINIVFRICLDFHSWCLNCLYTCFFVLFDFNLISTRNGFRSKSSIYAKVRINLILGAVHAFSKIILIVNLTIWLYDIRLEMLLVSMNSVILLIWFRIYVPTQKGEVVDLSLSYNYKSIIIF